MGEEVRPYYEMGDGDGTLPLYFIHDEVYLVIKGVSNYTLFYTSGEI